MGRYLAEGGLGRSVAVGVAHGRRQVQRFVGGRHQDRLGVRRLLLRQQLRVVRQTATTTTTSLRPHPCTLYTVKNMATLETCRRK